MPARRLPAAATAAFVPNDVPTEEIFVNIRTLDRYVVTPATLLGLAAALIVGVFLFVVFDVPVGPAEIYAGRVMQCHEPPGRFANATQVECDIDIGTNKPLTVWTPRSVPLGGIVRITERHMRYTARPNYQLAPVVPAPL
jgi:hypothetical protein